MVRAVEWRRQLSQLWQWFATQFPSSPLYGSVARFVAADDDVLDFVLQATPEAHLPLALLAAVHYLVLGGLDHPLAEVYGGASTADPGPLFKEVCLSHRDQLLEVMGRRRVQTNEVGRCALVGPALTLASRLHGGPLHLVDVGTSAGIVLCCDRFLLDYGVHGTTGPPGSPVCIDCQVRLGRPPIAGSLGPFASRIGIDRDPPDLADPDDVRWLLACVWPDSGRLERARSAIAEAQKDPPSVRRGDALELLPEVLDDLDGRDDEGVTCVLTTWSFGYLSLGQRAEFVEILATRARARRLVWVCGDSPGVLDMIPAAAGGEGHEEGEVLGAVSFDRGGAHPILLARVHPHGAWMDWHADHV